MVKSSKESFLGFKVVSLLASVPKSARGAAFLVKDKWDDWGKYQTQFYLVVFDYMGVRYEPGAVKIAKLPRTTESYWRTALPSEFRELKESFFSLGQDEKYYTTLMDLDQSLRNEVLQGLRDLVQHQELWKAVRNEDVVRDSFLRFVKLRTVEKQFRRILSGGARLTSYNLTYETSKSQTEESLKLSFDVDPEKDLPPTNIHVLIGPNGVGKTFLLQHMLKAIVNDNAGQHKGQCGEFKMNEATEERLPIANVVSVSFSAFDHFELVKERKKLPRTKISDYVLHSNIGLRRMDRTTKKAIPKTGAMLATEFAKSVWACINEPRLSRWQRAIRALETDPIFGDADLLSLTDYQEEQELKTRAKQSFNQLSSGHKLVLLTMTKLVETVDEQTLILFDEPETHLHPPLLSAFIRALSELLINRNGLAIIGTHSPVVLQEVPKSCVWKLRRPGLTPIAERPEIETFGENVGVLTSEVFGLEVTHSGFHMMISRVVEEKPTYDQVLNEFNGELGAEAQAIVLALTSG